MEKYTLKYLWCTVAAFLVTSCSVYREIPEGQYLLRKVKVETDGTDVKNRLDFIDLALQVPGSRWLGLFRRWGEDPVILDTVLCESSAQMMSKALVNRGYLRAEVDRDVRYSNRKKSRYADVCYTLKPGTLYTIGEYSQLVPDTRIDSILNSSGRAQTGHIVTGTPLDASLLDTERERIVSLMKGRGYFSFGKDDIFFVADTVRGSGVADLTMHVAPFISENGDTVPYPVYSIGQVKYIFSDDFSVSEDDLANNFLRTDVDGSSYYVEAGEGRLPLRPKVIISHSYLRPGMRYSSNAVSRTYSGLGRLSSLKYTNIAFTENPENTALDANVFMVSNKRHSFSAELEGTNTAGDLGAAASLSLVNRNLLGGSEKLTITLRGAFEAISNLPGYSGNSYKEYGIEANLDFPELVLPFISSDFQRRSQASSQLSIMLNSQSRPEFDKRVFTFGWSYLWSTRRHTHRLDVLDVNYLTVPWISEKFKEEYLDPIGSKHSILRYNYEDMLISKMGYSYYYSNANANARTGAPLAVSLRLNAESSGNLLNAVSNMFGAEENEAGQYQVMGIAFAQYLRSDGALTLNWNVNNWNNLLFHMEYGIAYPYANSTSVPFEKRYYAGGANCVRGWAVRELGPGRFSGSGDAVNYITQAGDVKLASSLEFRTHLFWKLNMALFVDAGNIWTIKDYEEQPGGKFGFDTFYRELGVSFGCGARLDLNFLVLRLDFGQQLVNPAFESGNERYPAFHSVDYRDYALHFAVGYPF